MLTILGIAGGAVATKLMNRAKLPPDTKQLIQEEEKLRKMVKKLEDEMREASQDKQRKQAKLDEMLRKATELQVMLAWPYHFVDQVQGSEHLRSNAGITTTVIDRSRRYGRVVLMS